MQSQVNHAADNVLRKSRYMNLGKMYGERVTRALFVGQAHH